MNYSKHYVLQEMFKGRIYSFIGEELELVYDEYGNHLGGLLILDNGSPITDDDLIAADIELFKMDYVLKRKKAIKDAEITDNDKLEALWSHIMEKDSTSANDIKSKIDIINQRHQPQKGV
jgi:hypothetical protein